MSQKAGHSSMLMFVVRLSQLLFFLSVAQIVVAQQRLFTNQQYFGFEEGLPQSFIGGIVLDDEGFIWLAT